MKETRVTLIDLDHTLVDHTSILNVVAQRISEHPLFTASGVSPYDIYQGLLSDWSVIRNLGFSDLRRLWLSREILLITLAICRQDLWPDLLKQWEDLQRSLNEDAIDTIARLNRESADAKSSIRVCSSAKATEFGILLAEKVARLSEDAATMQAIGALVDDISSLDGLFSMYPDAEDFLHDVSNLDGHVLYIVTEGDQYIQRLKFQRLRLDRYVTAQRFVTTNDLCHPPQLRELEMLAAVLCERLGDERRYRRARYGRRVVSAQIVRAWQQANQHVEYGFARAGESDPVAFFDKALEAVRFLAGRISAARLKAHPAFLPLLIHSIWRSPSDPRQGFRQVFSGAPLPPRRLKVAAVGDRYDVDLYPTLRLFGDAAITVRLRQGKYDKEYLADDLAALSKPTPTATFDSLRDAKQMLMGNDVWARARTIHPPSLASLVPEAASDSYLDLCLLFPEDSAAHRVAASIRSYL